MHTDLLNDISLLPNDTISHAISCIDKSGGEIALVVDTQRVLLGSITDGDIRRALLLGVNLEAAAASIMNKQPRYMPVGSSPLELAAFMRAHTISQVPILNNAGVLVDIIFHNDFDRVNPAHHKVVIMAGGIGSRLRPITENIPKPMIELGGRPILETIIHRFEQQGFVDIVLCVNYRADIIKDYFQDGSEYGVKISYIHEDKRMGTAGALSLLEHAPTSPMIVANGDVLTKMDYVKLLEFHYLHDARATMCLNVFKYQLPYGAVEVAGHRIKRITEKPVQQFLVNAGVYVISPDVLGLIPSDTFFDMPTLFDRLDEEARAAFPLHEYWLDIGQKPDLDRAHKEYMEIFGDDINSFSKKDGASL